MSEPLTAEELEDLTDELWRLAYAVVPVTTALVVFIIYLWILTTP